MNDLDPVILSGFNPTKKAVKEVVHKGAPLINKAGYMFANWYYAKDGIVTTIHGRFGALLALEYWNFLVASIPAMEFSPSSTNIEVRYAPFLGAGPATPRGGKLAKTAGWHTDGGNGIRLFCTAPHLGSLGTQYLIKYPCGEKKIKYAEPGQVLVIGARKQSVVPAILHRIPTLNLGEPRVTVHVQIQSDTFALTWERIRTERWLNNT